MIVISQGVTMSAEVYLLLGVFYSFAAIYMVIKIDERHQLNITNELTPEELAIQKNRFLSHEKEVELEIKMLRSIRKKFIRTSLKHTQSMR